MRTRYANRSERYKGRSGVSEFAFGPYRKGPIPKPGPTVASMEEMRQETETVFTAVDVTKLTMRIAERDRITAKLRDDAQALLLAQWARKRAAKIAKEMIFRQA